MGVGARYTWTSASASYADNTGSIEAKGRAHVLTLDVILEYGIPTGGHTAVVLGARAGGTFLWANLSRTIEFTSFPDAGSSGESSDSDSEMGVEPNLGFRYTREKYRGELSAGYRFLGNTTPTSPAGWIVMFSVGRIFG